MQRKNFRAELQTVENRLNRVSARQRQVMRVEGSDFWPLRYYSTNILGFCWPKLWAPRLPEAIPVFVRPGAMGVLEARDKSNERTGHAAFLKLPAENLRYMVIETASKYGYFKRGDGSCQTCANQSGEGTWLVR